MSHYTLKAELHLKLQGLEIVWPLKEENGYGKNEQGDMVVEMSIEPNRDHLLVFRRFADKCSYSLKDKIAPRRLGPAELIELAKE